jgi:ABC-2 type transport system ATP-binding protein
LWDLIRDYRAGGRTVLLTTHYMDEAERLCDRVAVVDRGKVIALGSPQELIANLGGEHVVEFTLDNGVVPEAGALEQLPAVRSLRREADRFCLSVTEPHVALPALLARLHEGGCRLASLSTRHASLEDVFVTLTGRRLRDEGEP